MINPLMNRIISIIIHVLQLATVEDSLNKFEQVLLNSHVGGANK